MFYSARLKLTIWYLLITMLVSMAFSAAIYRGLTAELDRFEKVQHLRIIQRFKEEGIPVPPNAPLPLRVLIENPELVQETKNRILSLLIAVNSGIFIVAGGVGYFLAGRTLKPIQTMVDEQNRFISDASHELRTPLTSLKASLEVFLRGDTPSIIEAKQLAKDSLDDVNQLQVLAESLLHLAQFEKPQQTVPLEECSIKGILTQAVKKVQPLANNKNIHIKLTGATFKVRGDEYALRDLFVILLDNAIKYSLPKTPITIGIKNLKTTGIVTVADKGIGIHKKDLPNIFDRFYRADRARSKTIKGFGLGLSIAKKIADTQNATISVKSAVGKGSTFIVSFSAIS